ncbi:YnbE family lipoprotein [Pseudodesulfovibrio sp. zrk46]|nr:YnbE family lipoprotein [Pseudodesulfovibrio sp. zrk46]
MTTMVTLIFVWGCQTSHRVEVAPVEVKPIHITIDVNVKVDKELDDFFSDIYDTEPEAPNAQ